MSPQMGHAAFRVAFFITFTSVVLLVFLRPGSAEFGVTLITLACGLIFIGIIVFMLRYFSR
jgi:preprotein translocase subunit Sss1